MMNHMEIKTFLEVIDNSGDSALLNITEIKKIIEVSGSAQIQMKDGEIYTLTETLSAVKARLSKSLVSAESVPVEAVPKPSAPLEEPPTTT